MQECISMTIKLKTGVIYFLRERNLGGEGYTPYCKIGLVAGDRTIEQRIKEHQTGNPRLIEELKSIETNAVTTLETHLHDSYATHRASGEWFRLEDDEFAAAIAYAQKASKKLLDEEKYVAAADGLKLKLSTLPERQATADELAWHATLVGTQKSLMELELENALVELKLKQLMGSSIGITGLVNVVFVAPKMELDKAALEDAHPGIYAQYLEEQPEKVSGSFSVVGKAGKRDLTESLVKEVDGLKKIVAASVPDEAAEPLPSVPDDAMQWYGEFLRRKSEMARLALEVDVLEARLKAACGEHEGITGVCKWGRKLKEQKPKFDSTRFADEHPGLIAQYQKERVSSPRISLRPYRATQGAIE